jgi:hypothetical protein
MFGSGGRPAGGCEDRREGDEDEDDYEAHEEDDREDLPGAARERAHRVM